MVAMKPIIVVLIVGILSIVSVVCASHPDLPTIFYGNVIQEDNSPAEGVPVTATWTTHDGSKTSRRVTSLTRKEAEDRSSPELAGYYLFTEGFVSAAKGTTITIDVAGVEKRIPAQPGLSSVHIPTVTVGHAPLESTGRGAIPDNPRVSDREALPRVPTSVFGTLKDHRGKPKPEVRVTATWTDEKGMTHTVETETLTEKEARELGDPSLEGYYMFNKGEIPAPFDSEINITFEEKQTQTIRARPGEIIEATEKPHIIKGKKLYDKNDPISLEHTRTSIVSRAGTFTRRAGTSLVTVGKHAIAYWYLISILPAALLVFYSVQQRGHIKRKIKQMIRENAQGHITKEIRRACQTKLSTLMTRHLISVQHHEKLRTVLDTMVNEEVEAVLVLKGTVPTGMISERSLLQTVMLHPDDWQHLSVDHAAQSAIVVAEPKDTVSHAITESLRLNTRWILVARNNTVEGIITHTNILQHLRQLRFSLSEASFPRVERATSKRVLIEERTCAADAALKKLVQTSYTAILIDSSKGVGGIVTDRDFINLLHKNPDLLHTYRLEQLMTAQVNTITPGTSIIDAVGHMTTRHCKQLPVVVQSQLKGILTESKTVRTLYKFLYITQI